MKKKLLLSCFISIAAVALGAEKPNIIFVLADDVSAKDLRCYNEHGVVLPTIGKMAKEGVMFQTAWAAPVCGPSRAILQTGKYPFKQGYFENYVEPDIPLWKNPRHQLVGQILKQSGYVNAWYGKIHFGGTPVNYGFDEYCTTQWWNGYDGPFQSPEKTTAGMYSVSWYWHPGLLENGKGLPTGPEDFGPQIESERILDFITRHKDQPFFVYWPSNLPHMAHRGGTPMNGDWFYPDVPVCDAGGTPTGGRIPGSLASNMKFLDDKLALIVRRLEELDILDNTIIFVAGDNGTPGYGKGKFESEVAPHVPFVVWAPELIKRRGTSPVLVDFSDILPTLAELAGAEIPQDVNGKSFAPYLKGQRFEPREWVFMQFNNARWLRDDRWLLDGYGRFYDCGSGRDESAGYGALAQGEPLGSNGPKNPDVGYRDVTKSSDPEAIAVRKRFEEILKVLPLPDYEDPETKKAWQKFRQWKAPVEVYRPDYL